MKTHVPKNSHVQKEAQNNTQITTDNEEIKKVRESMDQQIVKSGDDTFEVINSIKNSLKHTLKESKSSQSVAKWMFGITFGMGVVIIGFSIYFAFLDKALLSIAFGSIGLIDIIAHLIAKPPLQLQDARSNYTQLTVGVLAWFNDFIDKSAFISDYHRLSQAVLEEKGLTFEERLKIRKENLENAISVSNLQFENSIKMLRTIEEIAEPTRKKIIENKEVERKAISEIKEA